MITFKSFQSYERMSEETTAYDTKVFFEGKPLGTCSNRGTGGQGSFHRAEGVTQATLEKAHAWAVSQTYKEPDGSVSQLDGKPMQFDSIEDYCDYLAHETHENKMVLGQLKRSLKTKTLFIDPAREPGIYQLARVYSEALKTALEAKYPGATVLNALPMDKALDLYKQESVRMAKAEQAAYEAKQQAAAPKTPKMG